MHSRSMVSHSGHRQWLRYIHFTALLTLLWQPQVSAQDYRVGPNDLLRISVFDHPELSLETRVSESGNISFAPVGSVPVAGRSTQEVEQLLAKKLNDARFVRSPQVSVIVGDYQSQKVSVIGQVGNPGQYALSQTQRVLDVLSLAGGVLHESAADRATLMHKDGSSQKIDLKRLMDGDLSLNLPLAGGDTLSVPRASQFYIYGEVQHPGVYRLTQNMTLSQAISMGGGLTRHGTERRAIVKRRDANGIEKEYRLHSTDLLQADDVLFIKESLF